ncbi:MAG: orotidine-5'-phosphate decarboxylase [Myxococcaceae bacterium]|nr:orotidine-5'-phosphate decarboxylase [Myxococcaceae bacterium]
MVDARNSIALALDLPLADGERLLKAVGAHVGVAKVGLSLFVEHGPRAVEVIRGAKADVFLDLKLHDIPNTVELAAARASALGVKYLTVHAGGGRQMLEAAVRGAESGAKAAAVAAPVVLAVTVLTSMNAADLKGIGVSDPAAVQVERLAKLAKEAGAGGLVCSVQEVAALRALLGRSMVLCTPGIRPAGAAAGDQARVDTPAAAVKLGADLLVVGRPIYEATDPAVAAKAIHDEVAGALG